MTKGEFMFYHDKGIIGCARNETRQRGIEYLARIRDEENRTDEDRAVLDYQIDKLKREILRETQNPGSGRIYDAWPHIETRTTPTGPSNAEWRLTGYASVFGALSRNLGGYYDRVMPGAFRDVLKDDCVLNIDHDNAKTLARVHSGTLRLWEDDFGLAFSADLPLSTLGRDTVVMIQRGDLRGMSTFTLRSDEHDKWVSVREADDTVKAVREIHKITRLVDIALAWYPAVEATNGTLTLERIADVRKGNRDI